MNKVFVSDIDGTCLKKGEKELSLEVKEAFNNILLQNNTLIIASGRTYRDLRRLFNNNSEIIYIAENGNLAVYKDEFLLENKFEDGVAENLIRYLDTLKYFDLILVSTSSKCLYYCQNGDIIFDNYRNPVGKSKVSIDEFLNYFNNDIIKVSVFKENLDSKYHKFYELFNEKYKDLEIFDSNNNWIDFSPRNGNKGEALKFVLNKFNLKKEDLIVFGDGENDISMLKLTLNSYCPISSLEIVKKNSSSTYLDFSSQVNSILVSFSNKCE